MRWKLYLVPLLLLLFTVSVQTQNPGRTCVRHVNSPTRYPAIARLARLQGTVIAKLKISPDGSVADVTVEAEDSTLKAHPVLQSETQKLVHTWTFECPSCTSGLPFEHVIRFNYRLEGKEAQFDDTRITMDLPDEVTIIARPPVCDHCPEVKQ